MSVDLHTHTTHSDGTLEPADLVKLAAEENLYAIAITDHDITSGVEEALVAGDKYGIKIVPGIELSVNYDLPGSGHLHICGLFIDPDHPLLTVTLQNLRLQRTIRNKKILKRLERLDMPVSKKELSMISGSGSVGRPHIAAAMVKKGYVKNSREAFQRFLKKGSPAYFERVRLDADKAIDMIHLTGGIAIIAHPNSLGLPSQKVLEAYILHLKTIGLDGIEVYCSGMNENSIQTMLSFARENDLVVSGGSDFHGAVKPEIQLGIGKGDLNVPDQVYRDLITYWEERN